MSFAVIEKERCQNGNYFTRKVYNKSHGKLVYEHYQRELQAFKQLRIASMKDSIENHIIYLLDHDETPNAYRLKFPYYSQNLESFIYTHESDVELAKKFLLQIAQGLHYIHQHNIVHCDLSPSNILIQSESCIMISDFGCAQAVSDTSMISSNRKRRQDFVFGTRWYKAPEHLFGSTVFAPATDIWSLGAIFVQLLIGYPIFVGQTDIEQIGQITFRIGKASVETQIEEMVNYPDFDKLNFFFTEDDIDGEEEFDLTDEELQARKPLDEIFAAENVPEVLQLISKKMLTWSVRNRLSAKHIIALLTE
ncbi:kinase-like domain-containing protein [Mycotypha africana]|uniref:kinase-like domain-containing protein n=1 Tax=Mycotypha africana TaxID=64632 RepID=UPI00230046C0|nr:kinase-like domain-containing protein [Mycotypha africana]KAI8971491.1 kinase-like domain-containing protein [Mycotypha africana]